MISPTGAQRAAWLMVAALLPWIVFVSMHISGALGDAGFLESFAGPMLEVMLCGCFDSLPGLVPLLVALIVSLPISLWAMGKDRLRYGRLLLGINFLPSLLVGFAVSFIWAVVTE